MMLPLRKPWLLATIALFLLTLASPTMLAAQTQQAVAMIRPVLSDGQKQMWAALGNAFEKQGQSALAVFCRLKAQAKVSGSGFLVTRQDGARYVLTSRQAIGLATHADLIFSLEDGKNLELKNCPVAFQDDLSSFAAIIPQGKSLDKLPSLNLAASLPRNNLEVWAAGYSASLGKAQWKLSPGTLGSARTASASSGASEGLQHSAPVDAAMCGGPLLAGDPDNPETLRVIGLNTSVSGAKLGGAGAIPLGTLRELLAAIPVLQAAQSGIDAKSLDQVRDRTLSLVALLEASGSDQSAGFAYISNHWVLRQGWDAFITDALKLPAAKRGLHAVAFNRDRPIDSLRTYLYQRIASELRAAPGQFELKPAWRADWAGKPAASIVLGKGEAQWRLDWLREAGVWRLAGINLEKCGLTSLGKTGAPFIVLNVPKDPAPRLAAAAQPKAAEQPKNDGESQKPANTLVQAGTLKAPSADSGEKPGDVPSGFSPSFGYVALPMLSGWQTGGQAGLGAQLGFGSFLGVGLQALGAIDTELVKSGIQDTRPILGLELALRMGYLVPANRGGVFPYFLGNVSGGLYAIPVETVYTRFSVVRGVFGFGIGTGLLFKFSDQSSFGLEGFLKFNTDSTLPRMASMPLRAYIVF